MSKYTRSDLNAKCNVDDNGVYRWKTSNNVVPGDILKDAGFSDTELDTNARARNEQIERSLKEYINKSANRSYDEIREARAEARAAFGPGVELVNVITGEKFTT